IGESAGDRSKIGRAHHRRAPIQDRRRPKKGKRIRRLEKIRRSPPLLQVAAAHRAAISKGGSRSPLARRSLGEGGERDGKNDCRRRGTIMIDFAAGYGGLIANCYRCSENVEALSLAASPTRFNIVLGEADP